jgi:hypothetical protein
MTQASADECRKFRPLKKFLYFVQHVTSVGNLSEPHTQRNIWRECLPYTWNYYEDYKFIIYPLILQCSALALQKLKLALLVLNRRHLPLMLLLRILVLTPEIFRYPATQNVEIASNYLLGITSGLPTFLLPFQSLILLGRIWGLYGLIKHKYESQMSRRI